MWTNKDVVLVKYYNGNAYYTSLKDQKPPHYGSNVIKIRHLLSHGEFEARLSDLKVVQWDDIPESYRMDACAINNFVRDNCNDWPEIKGKNRQNMSKSYMIKQYGNNPLDSEYEIMFGLYGNQFVYMWKEEYDGAKGENSCFCGIYDPLTDADINEDGEIERDEVRTVLLGEVPQTILAAIYEQNGELARIYVVETEGNSVPNQPQLATKRKSMKTNMLSTLGLEMGKYEGNELALSMAGIATKKKNGDYVVYDKANRQLIEVGDLKMDVPFFMMPLAYPAIQEGDMLKIDGQFYIVEAKTADNGLKCISPTTGSTVHKIARTNLFNMHFYTKIISMMDGFGNMAGQEGGAMNPMMMMMFMGNKDGEGSNMDGMMEMMLMGQMFGAGQNPFGNMFGTPAAPPKAIKKAAPAKKATLKKRAIAK